MHDRAPGLWINPNLPRCRYYKQENCAKPIISEKKKSINWLFLLLGQMLGCCTLEQIKYCYKHTRNHHTGAKDRVLYLTYLSLCKQLDPYGPFDRSTVEEEDEDVVVERNGGGDDQSQTSDYTSEDEGTEDYRRRGYHAVRIGGTFKHDRYVVQSKLG
ncbi:unnamed protein product [Fraxinus pennsylvanica]|uniref:DUF7086 domain-containing protein n=1 Tax=Fraxinus pennsylvanica TaxID=56036 RepID=A0AAD2ADZ8_9LAMI|nr:unnamed protein product [Fraxinus pennsylvanica]